jgi:hemolysin D
METMKYQQTVLQTQKGQRDDAIATLNVLTRERQKIIDAFIADNSQKLAEAQRQADDFEQKLAKARLKSGRMTLSSPIDGVVLGLSVTTVGQVIATGDEIMRIVPEDATLEIECYLANKDVGFVKPGQTAVVKIESFPFTRYGTLSAQVRRVAHDAIPEPDAQQAEGDPSKTNKQDKLFAGAQRTQNLVFSVTLTPNKTVMNVDGQTVPLTPGMAVSVEIATGNRRILEYLFSPLVEVGSEALKER